VKSADWDQRYASAERVWSAEPNPSVVGITRDLRPGRALDLACGEGADAIWLAERGWRVTAVDFSDVALRKAASEARARKVEVEWVSADLRAYKPTPVSFDLVVILYLHLPPVERRTILSRAAAALAPGGTLLVVGHDRTNPPDAPGPKRPEILFTPDEIAADLTGLDVERADRIPQRSEVQGQAVTGVDTLVVARRSSAAR
jgi:SAM-dependent methyltransferase